MGHPYRLAPPPSLAPPPRKVGHRLWLRIAFGGNLTFVAASLNAVILWLVCFLVANAESPISPYDERVPGVIDRVTDAGSPRGESPVYAIDYHYTDHRGVERRGTSYTVTPPASGDLRPVTVELDGDDPAWSRIVGMDRTKSSVPFSQALLLLAVLLPFAAMGVGLARRKYRDAREALHLLRHGVPTRGKLVSKRVTGDFYEDLSGRRYEEHAMVFEFRDDRGRVHRTTVKTYHPERLEDDGEEALIYDPNPPWRATTLDHLPGAPRVRRDGTLDLRAGGFPYHLAVFPVVAILAVPATVVTFVIRIVT